VDVSRRELLQGTALAAAAPFATAAAPGEWIRSARILIAEGYNAPFYPELTYDPHKALLIARRLNAAALRFPAAAYRAFFPTRTLYPKHPELHGRDLLRDTIEVFHQAGLKVVVYIPFNHPFMSTNELRPEYEDWCKRDMAGKPMLTGHYGYGTYYEGCMNSPIRVQIAGLIREVVTHYPVDLVYFDGPYQGMQRRDDFCHCRYCEAAYRRAKGRAVPVQNRALPLEEEIAYRDWLRDEVFTAGMRETCGMIRGIRDVPIFYNDTGLLSRHEPRSRIFTVLDGFMFEHAETPEQKLFNIQLGRSTGKVIWTYIGSYSQYNREHIANRTIYGWFSYPVESQELLADGAAAIAAGAGLKYWGLARFYNMPKDPLEYESGRHVKELFDFAEKHEALLRAAEPVYPAGILVGSQTIDWYAGRVFVHGAYRNCYYGAQQMLKDLGYDAEPFLDYQATVEKLAKYALVLVPNAICLSAAQCDALRQYVEHGGTLLATHLTSAADEYGRAGGDFQLADLLGARLVQAEPAEIPDLFLRQPPSTELLVPQDPQIAVFERIGDARVLAEAYDLGRQRVVGPAVITRNHGRGRVVYIGSSLEAVYEETRMAPIREYFRTLLAPVLDPVRPYTVGFHPGLTAQFARSETTLLLHLLAQTGNKWKKLSAREQFLPLENVKVRLRLPTARNVKSVDLLHARRGLPFTVRNGWAEMSVPHVWIHEAVRLELS
jgi:Hypothetical glycosyl hydrolase 6/Beta-galactosidase trimerisation domain